MPLKNIAQYTKNQIQTSRIDISPPDELGGMQSVHILDATIY